MNNIQSRSTTVSGCRSVKPEVITGASLLNLPVARKGIEPFVFRLKGGSYTLEQTGQTSTTALVQLRFAANKKTLGSGCSP
jgi:hypothetical protein